MINSNNNFLSQIIHFKNHFRKHYLPKNLKREVLELYASTIIRNFAISLISIFVPVYFYTLGYSLQWIVFYYAIVYTIVFFTVPLGAKLSARFGFEHCMLYSIPALIVYYLILYFIPSFPFCFFITAFLLAFYKIIFWPAYHTDFAHYGNKFSRAKEISALNSLIYLVTIAGPIIGGIILTIFGFKVLFIVVCLILFTSIIPLFTTREIFKPKQFGYFEAFKRFLNPRFYRARLAFMGAAEEIVEAVCWPIFIFVVLTSYTSLGLITSGATVASFLSILFIGKWADEKNKRKMVKISAVILSLTWPIRFFARTSWGLLFINSLSGVSKRGISIPMTTIIYNAGCKRGNLKCVIFREMSLNLGRGLMAWGLVGVLFFTNSWLVIFVLAAFASLLYMKM
jgi:MFS family permease